MNGQRTGIPFQNALDAAETFAAEDGRAHGGKRGQLSERVVKCSCESSHLIKPSR
jgi:hypothetical protein